MTNCKITITQISPPLVTVTPNVCPTQVKVTEETITVGITLGNGLPGATGVKGDDGDQGIQGVPGADGSTSPTLGLFLFWDHNHPSFYLRYSYIGGVLDIVDMFEDNTLTTKLMSKQFNYTLGVLSQIVITRISDAKTEVKDFAYVGGNLSSQTVSQP